MLAIVKLRLMQLKNDYKAILVMTGLALLLSFVFGSSATSGYKPLVAIVDMDKSETSIELIRRIESERSYRFKELNYDDAKADIESNKLNTAIVINNGFEKEFGLGESVNTSIMAIENGVNVMNIEFMLKSQITSMMRDYKIALEISKVIVKNTDVAFEKVFVEAMSDINESWTYKRSINVLTSVGEGKLKNYDSTMHSVLGFTIMFAAFTIIFSIGGIIEDKEHGTWNRMIISPINRVSIIGQNMIVTIAIGIFQVFIILLLSSLVFGVSYGNSNFGIFIMIFSFVFAVSSMGFFIATIVKTQMQLSVTTPIILTSFAMLGGCMWPLEIVNSKLLIYLSYIVPHRWALEGLEGLVSKSWTLNQIMMPSGILILMGVSFMTIGSVFLNKAGELITSK